MPSPSLRKKALMLMNKAKQTEPTVELKYGLKFDTGAPVVVPSAAVETEIKLTVENKVKKKKEKTVEENVEKVIDHVVEQPAAEVNTDKKD